MVPGAAQPQDFNRYSFVRNNPLKYVDPSGHIPICIPFAGCYEVNTSGIAPIRQPDGLNVKESEPQSVEGKLEPTRTIAPQATGIPLSPVPQTPQPFATATLQATKTPTPRPTESVTTIVVYRMISGTNKGEFKNLADADGLSVWEIPRIDPKRKPLPMGLTYKGQKEPGTLGTLEHSTLAGGIAEYTPQIGGEGHWSIRFPGLDLEEAKQKLSDYAKEMLKQKSHNSRRDDYE
jgi:hypothetical protein